MSRADLSTLGVVEVAQARSDPPATTAERWPQHRPPVAIRLAVAVLGLGAIAFNALILLSDRAPAAIDRVVGRLTRELSARIDADTATRLAAAERRLPEDDTLVHIGIWAAAVVLVGFAVWNGAMLMASAVVVFGVSALLEAAQGRYSTNRTVDLDDAVANGVGVVLGVGVVALTYLVGDAIAASRARRPAR